MLPHHGSCRQRGSGELTPARKVLMCVQFASQQFAPDPAPKPGGGPGSWRDSAVAPVGDGCNARPARATLRGIEHMF